MIELMDMIAQGVILLTGGSAIYLAASKEMNTRMWAGIIGLAGEPFWLATTVINQQWGIAPLVLWYAWNWWRVYRNNRNEK